jgi:hypothetical protein
MEQKLSSRLVKSAGCMAMIVVAIAGLLHGCAKDGGVCVSSSGQVILQERAVIPDFDSILLTDNVSIILTDSVCPVWVEAGENIIDGIRTIVDSGYLTISNSNSCNWLRDYGKPINVYVSGNKVRKIKYNGSGNISNTGTLTKDTISIEVWGGCGSIDLTLDIDQGNFSLNLGTADYRLKGICKNAYVYVSDFGLYDGSGLKSVNTYITTAGSNDCKVNANGILIATINSIGNVFYYGNPTVTRKGNGSGQVLPY